MTQAEHALVERMAVWIKSFSWKLNDYATDAELDITIAGIARGSDQTLAECFDVDGVNERVVRALVEKKVAQFEDAFTIEELDWNFENITNGSGRQDREIHIFAAIHLAES